MIGRALPLVAIAVLGACGGDRTADRGPVRVFRDTEGRLFGATCNARSICDAWPIAAVHAPPTPDEEGADASFELSVWGRYHVLCDAFHFTDGREWSDPFDDSNCRGVACATDADCLPAYGLPHVRCVGGLCGDPRRPLTRGDLLVLCMAGTGTPDHRPFQRRRAALLPSCAPPCEVPPGCRAP